MGINYQRILHRSEGAKNNENVAADLRSVDTSLLRHPGLAQASDKVLFEPVVQRRCVPVGVLSDLCDCAEAIVVARPQRLDGFGAFGGGASLIALEPVGGAEQR